MREWRISQVDRQAATWLVIGNRIETTVRDVNKRQSEILPDPLGEPWHDQAHLRNDAANVILIKPHENAQCPQEPVNVPP